MTENIHIDKADPQGASRLLLKVEKAIALFNENPTIIAEMQYPTIATQKGGFPPVLFLSRLSEVTGYIPILEEIPQRLQRAYHILEILKDLRSGKIDFSNNTLKYLARRMGQANSSFRDTSSFFDIFYGALQLLIYAELVEPEKAEDAHELFMIACGMGLVVAEAINARYLPFHIDHFKVHAAVYLATRNSDEAWSVVRERSYSYLDKWGDEPPPESILIHAAHNLFIKVQGLPVSDQVYDFVKAARKEVCNDKTLEINNAFAMMNDALGWKQSAALIRLLWDNETRKHYIYTRNVVARRFKENGYAAAYEYAQKISFVGDDGLPLLKTPSDIPIKRGATLSFPGGVGIGKTSVICKMAGSYIMIDYGRDPYGRTPHWRPELDLLDAVLITHAHQDHIGGLLDLYGRQEYKGAWYAPVESEALIRLSLLDSVKLEEAKFEDKARHKDDDVDRIFSYFIPLDMGTPTLLNKTITVTAFAAGHVTGSCQYLVEGGGTSIFFSGDFNLMPCRSVPSLVLPPVDVLERVDALVLEGTYAFRDETITNSEDAVADLLQKIRSHECRPVLVPVLSLGRAQEVIAALSGTELKVGVFGLARQMTAAMKFPVGKNVTLDARNPKRVNKTDYDVLVASSGCLQGGPSKVFFQRKDFLPLPIILTGYLFPGTPARDLTNTLEKIRFSAHVNYRDWLLYLDKFPNAQRFLIHYPGDRNIELSANMVIPQLGKAYQISHDDKR
jgi:Cft2 family RNA processing exonuclease